MCSDAVLVLVSIVYTLACELCYLAVMWMVHSLPRTLLSFSYYHRREKSTPPLFLVFCTEYYVLFLARVVF